MAKRITKTRCSKCRLHGAETFWFMRQRFIFDVDLAREISSDGRAAVELDPDDARFEVKTSHINWHHVPHVDASIPGIVAHVFYPQEGEIIRGHLLIDGHHRAARALERKLPFHVYLLSEDESRRIVIKSPELAVPA